MRIELDDKFIEFPDDAPREKVEAYMRDNYNMTVTFEGENDTERDVRGGLMDMASGFMSWAASGDTPPAALGKGFIASPIVSAKNMMDATVAEAEFASADGSLSRDRLLEIWFDAEIGIKQKLFKTFVPYAVSKSLYQAKPTYEFGRYSNIDEAVKNSAQWVSDLADNLLKEKFFETKHKFAFDLGAGMGSLIQSVGLLSLTKNPAIVTAAFGYMQKGSMYSEAKKKGMDDYTNAVLSDVFGLIEGSLEALGAGAIVNKIKGNNPLWVGLKGGLTEFITETLQQGGEETLANLTGLREESVGQIVQTALYSGLIGFITGSGAGGYRAIMDRKNIKQKLITEFKITETQAETIMKGLYDKANTPIKNEMAKIADEMMSEIAKQTGVEIDQTNEGVPLDVENPISVDLNFIPDSEAIVEGTQQGEDSTYQLSDIVDQMKAMTEAVNAIPESMEKEQLLGTLSRLSEEGNVKRRIKETTEPKKKTVTIDEQKLTNIVMRRMSQAARSAFREAKRLTKQALSNKIKEKKESIDGLQKDAIRYAKAFMPRAIRGDVLAKIASLKTQNQFDKLLEYMDEKVTQYEKKRLDARIKKAVKAVEKSTTIPDDFKEAILSIARMINVRQPIPDKDVDLFKMLKKQAEEEGRVVNISEEDESLLNKKDLKNLSLEEAKRVYELMNQIAHLGRTMNKFVKAVDKQRVDDVVNDMYQATGVEEGGDRQEFEGKKKGKKEYLNWAIAGLTKIEFLLNDLDGGKVGVFTKNIYNRMLEAHKVNTVINEMDFAKINDILEEYRRNNDPLKMFDQVYDFKGQKISKNAIMAMYANSLNEHNLETLLNGYKITPIELQEVLSNLTEDDRVYVEKTIEVLRAKATLIAATLKELTGENMEFVENYFPLVFKGDTYTDLDEDKMKYMMGQISVGSKFTESRIKKASSKPIDLDFYGVSMGHLRRVNFFISSAVAAQDVRVLLNNKRFQALIEQTKGVDFMKSLREVAAHTFRPNLTVAQGMTKEGYSFLNMLKNVATAGALGVNPIVSLAQFGSITQAIPEIGLRNLLEGMDEFFSNPMDISEVIEAMSVELKFRADSLDNTIREFMETGQAKRLLKGKSLNKSALFTWIHFVDGITVRSVWWAEFKRQMKETNGNREFSAEAADRVVRKTQPMMTAKDMPALMQRGNVWKLITPFFSHFSTTGNLWGEAIRNIATGRKDWRYGLMALLMYYLVPALYSAVIKAGGTPKGEDVKRALIGYAAAPVPLLRDAISYKMGLPGIPSYGRALKEILDITNVVKPNRTFGSKGKDVIESLGFSGFLGPFPSLAAGRAFEGIVDILSGRTTDLRRIIFSKYALHEE